MCALLGLVSLVFSQPSMARLHYIEVITDALIAIASLWLPLSLIYLVRRRREKVLRIMLALFCGYLIAIGISFMLRMLPFSALWLATIIAGTQEVAAVMGIASAVMMMIQLPRILKIPDPSADGLTGLCNRMRFDERLEQLLNRAQIDRSYHFAVLFIDLDGFKLVNDDLGHNVGDELLRAVSRRLRGTVRSRDLVARYGGDEFTVLLDGIPDLEFAEKIASRLIENVQQPFVINGHGVHVGASIGIVASGGDRNARQMIGAADQAMYRAKTTRRGSYEVWNSVPSFSK
ncbi:MAG TPA: GGDEF domain-containing protein [Candidatus Baltobacteraceae bacterium]